MLTLAQALESIRDRKEFAVIRDNGLVTINYLFQDNDSFEGLRANLRGIVFDEATGELVSLPFHKFFNVNQVEHTQFHKISHLSATIYEKLDGSMIHFYRHGGNLHSSTRMSRNTPQAKEAMRFVEAKENKAVLDLIHREIDQGRTPIFEYTGPRNQVVVVYPLDRLVYLASRDRKTGLYSFVDGFPIKAVRFNFPFHEIHDRLKGQENFEGYVCWLETGLWVKAKNEWYLERHHAFDALMRPKWKLFAIAFQGLLDDVIAASADRYKPVLRELQTEANRDFIEMCVLVRKTSLEVKEKCKDDDLREARKRFAIYCQKNHPQLFGLLMAEYQGKEITELVHDKLIEKYKLMYPTALYFGLTEE